ncbi:hypothetical protein K491DRAFT_737936 [Lophiostoma macrostomum CBS 122681]|uniref:HMG box domain-containing protein n=1 Tax=Lophiostoma macrostomum CBS 122681 TaxID=1314788 RepID=A0A6A6SMU5_9PLEO|nr:hypothetical protein K491DRAFT_737936 [Lophiostoma macrostomum CBS 122681]
MASVPKVADAEQILKTLDVQKLATRVYAGHNLIKSVVQHIQQVIEVQDDLMKVEKSLKDEPSQVNGAITTVICNLDVSKLAADNCTTEDAIRRILDGIMSMTGDADIESNGNNAEQSSAPSLLNTFVGAEMPTSHLGQLAWPASIPLHALGLSKALAHAAGKSETYGRYARIVPVADFMTLVRGATLLAEKTAMQGANNVNGAQVPAGSFARQPPHPGAQAGRGQVVARPPIGQGAATAATIQVSPGIGSMKLSPAALGGGIKRPSSSPPHAPHLRTVDHMAQPVIQTPSASAYNVRHAVHNGKPITLKEVNQPNSAKTPTSAAGPQQAASANSGPQYVPFARNSEFYRQYAREFTSQSRARLAIFPNFQTAEVANSASGSPASSADAARSTTPKPSRSKKHALSRSPGQSPEKKKTTKLLYPYQNVNMGVKATLAPKEPRPKSALSAYLIWGMVARPEMSKIMPGLGMAQQSPYIGKIWNAMDEQEKEPYKALQREDVERFMREEAILARGEKISVKTEEQWREALKLKAAAVFEGLKMPSDLQMQTPGAASKSAPGSAPSSARSTPAPTPTSAPVSTPADATKSKTGVSLAATARRSSTPMTGSSQGTATAPASSTKSSRGTLKERDGNGTVPRTEKPIHKKVASQHDIVKDAIGFRKKTVEDFVGKENMDKENINKDIGKENIDETASGKTGTNKLAKALRSKDTPAKKDEHKYKPRWVVNEKAVAKKAAVNSEAASGEKKDIDKTATARSGET